MHATVAGQVPVGGRPGVQKQCIAGIGKVGDHAIAHCRAGSDTSALGHPTQVRQKPRACGQNVGSTVRGNNQPVFIPDPNPVPYTDISELGRRRGINPVAVGFVKNLLGPRQRVAGHDRRK